MLVPKLGMPQEILEKAKPLHSRLAKAAVYLWENDLKRGPVVSDIRRDSGHLDMAGDFTRYASLFRDNRDRTSGRCDTSQTPISMLPNA